MSSTPTTSLVSQTTRTTRTRDSFDPDLAYYASSPESTSYLARPSHMSLMSDFDPIQGKPQLSPEPVPDQEIEAEAETGDTPITPRNPFESPGQHQPLIDPTPDSPETPPAVPPKSSSHATLRTLSVASCYSDDSMYTAESAQPMQATHARRASASSHNLLNMPSTSSLVPIPAAQAHVAIPEHTEPPLDLLSGSPLPSPRPASVASGKTEAIEKALARLPWAEPPPRVSPTTPSSSNSLYRNDDFGAYLPVSTVSSPANDQPTFDATVTRATPMSSVSSRTPRPLPPIPSLSSGPPGPLGSDMSGQLSPPIQGNGSRGPRYSFLASDPTRDGGSMSVSRRSSKASVASSRSRGPNSPLPPLPITPISPTAPSSRSGAPSTRPPSQWHEGDFPLSPTEEGGDPSWGNARPISSYSGMAEIGFTPSPHPSTFGHHDTPDFPFSPTSPSSAMADAPTRSARSSISSAVRALSSVRSKSRTGKSTRSKSIRSTKSTKSSHTKRGSTSTIGHRFGNKRWDWDSKVTTTPPVMVEAEALEWLDSVKKNEEMMDLLALVGRATVLERMLKKGKRLSNASSRFPRGPARMSISSLHRRLTSSARTSSRSGKRASFSASSRAPSRSTNNHTPRTSQSIRQRLSRRIKRKSSQEDMFTELDSDEDEDDPSLFPLENQQHAHPTSKPAKRASLPPSSYVRPFNEKPIRRSSEIIVFPHREERGKPPPPPIPEKDIGLSCRQVTCIEPSSPTPLLLFPVDLNEKERDVERGEVGGMRRTRHSRQISGASVGSVGSEGEMGEGGGDGDGGGGREYHPQSPHLGHRSPNWRNRQSVISHLSTGQWDKRARRRWWIGIGVGAGILLVVIIGLLVGLLTRRR